MTLNPFAWVHSHILLSLLAISPLLAQTIDTGILGTVRDSTGAVVAGAPVTISQSTTGLTRTVGTNAEGYYEVRYLLPGEYSAETHVSGFRSERQTGIVIQIGQQARINFTIQVGAVEERLEVTADAPLIQTENAAMGAVVSQERVVNLPLNGRRFLDLAALTPGVTLTTSAQYSILKTNGTRNTTMALSFDGASATTNRWAFVAMFPSLDAIQEFKVLSGSYTAEYGGNAGANVNVQLKSGTNNLHGSAYEFLRNNDLDARNYFRPGPLTKDVLHRNQFGAVIDGRIIKDKTFFMVGWESQRNLADTAGTNITLTPAQRLGDFSAVSTRIIDPLSGNPFPGNIIPADRLNPVSVNLANTYLPLPNQPGSINYAYLSRPYTKWNQALTRIDHRISDKDQLSGHYMIQNYAQPTVGAIPQFRSEADYLNQNVEVQEIHTFSGSRLNEVRFGYQRGFRTSTNPRKGTDFSAASVGINGLLQGGPNGRPLTKQEAGFPNLSISGFLGISETGGSDYDFSRTFQFVDNFSLFHGNHAFKMGVDIRRAMSDADTINWPYGQIDFTSDISGNAASAFMLGYPRDTLTPEGQPISAVRQWRDFFYFQDDWKVRPNLTLNLGVRYDLLTLPHDINGNGRTLRFDLPGGPVLWPPDSRASAATKGTVADMWINEHWHVVPRVGLAYRYNERTVVRSGYGIFTATNQMDHVNVLQLNPPIAGSLTVINSAIPVATIQNPVPLSLYAQQAVFNVVSIAPDRRHINPYVQNWNLQVSRQLSRNDALDVGYFGNKGTFLDTSQLNFNSPDPGPGDIQARRPYQGFGRIRLLTTDGNSTYHSLQMHFEHRLAQGLSLTAAYNWAHMIDDQQDETNGARCLCQDPRHRGKNDKGSSIQDIRHRFVVGYVWELPSAAGLHAALRSVVGGWQFGGIVTLQSGGPFNVSISADTQNVDPQGAARPILVPGQKLTVSNPDPSLWFNTAAFVPSVFQYGNTPRNPLVGPGLHTFDLSLGKQFKLPYKEGHVLQFRTEFFNAFNTPEFANPGASLGTGSFGKVTGTSAANRQIQFGLRYAF